jgi:hypothetical protein
MTKTDKQHQRRRQLMAGTIHTVDDQKRDWEGGSVRDRERQTAVSTDAAADLRIFRGDGLIVSGGHGQNLTTAASETTHMAKKFQFTSEYQPPLEQNEFLRLSTGQIDVGNNETEEEEEEGEDAFKKSFDFESHKGRQLASPAGGGGGAGCHYVPWNKKVICDGQDQNSGGRSNGGGGGGGGNGGGNGMIPFSPFRSEEQRENERRSEDWGTFGKEDASRKDDHGRLPSEGSRGSFNEGVGGGAGRGGGFQSDSRGNGGVISSSSGLAAVMKELDLSQRGVSSSNNGNQGGRGSDGGRYGGSEGQGQSASGQLLGGEEQELKKALAARLRAVRGYF